MSPSDAIIVHALSAVECMIRVNAEIGKAHRRKESLKDLDVVFLGELYQATLFFEQIEKEVA